MNRISALMNPMRELAPHCHTGIPYTRSQQPATLEEISSPEPNRAGTLISGFQPLEL